MVLMSFGDPDQKKVDDVDSTNPKETWFLPEERPPLGGPLRERQVAKTQVF
jgi:hypothetical protein